MTSRPPELSCTEPLTVNEPSWSRPIEKEPSWLIETSPLIAIDASESRPIEN